ncbi:MAG: hypothetical protein KAQ68_04210 [Clostridiales bacterium]|nr:hypothetical protein [Clostridiales bacterium]
MKRVIIISSALFLMGAVAIGILLINRPEPVELNLDGIIIEPEQIAFGAETVEEGATLNLITEGNGSVEVSPFEKVYPAGTRIKLSARPHEGWIFVNWLGDVPERLATKSDITIPVFDSEYNITAVFAKK